MLFAPVVARRNSYVLFASSALLHGIGWAVWFTAAPNVLATWFGVADLGGTVGTLYLALGFGALAGPAVLGFVIDGSGYEIAIAMVMVTSAMAMLPHSRTPRYFF